MNRPTDQQLLRDYASRRSDAAFAELVRRHLDLVYSAALRMVCDAHLAQDVTQGAFVALAKNARRLAGHPVLSGWLHRTAQNLAANAVRSEVRRRAREQEAAAMNQLLAAGTDASWEVIAPHLDAALGELNETERDAVLLRYFERKSARDMAEILGTSEDTAQKRVSRAVERLRDHFSRRNVTIGAGGLVALISANAVQSAPTGLAATISSAIKLTATTLGMTMLHKILITGITAAAVGTAIYAGHLRNQLQSLQQQQAALAGQISQLNLERDDATNQLAALQRENTKAQADEMELLRLRNQVTLSGRQQHASPPATQIKTNGADFEPLAIHTKARFISVPAGDFRALEQTLGVAWTTGTLGDKAGLLTGPQFKAVFEALRGENDVETIAEPEVETSNGRQSQIMEADLVLVNGTNAPIGTILDMNASFSTNTSTFTMSLVAKLNMLPADSSQPDMRTIEATNQMDLSPGQTVLLEQEIPDGGWLPGSTNIPAGPRSLLIFVTPQVVDARGFQKTP